VRTWLLTPLIFLSLHAQVHACTWEGLSPQSVEQRLPPMIVQADVHGVEISSPRAMPVSEWLLASLQKATSPAR
jgi:hypothetical protein